MFSVKELDLIGVVSPVCLLKCKRVLSEMSAGETLDILLQDPDVVEELVKIIDRSADKVIQTAQERDHYRIRLIKGETFNGGS